MRQLLERIYIYNANKAIVRDNPSNNKFADWILEQIKNCDRGMNKEDMRKKNSKRSGIDTKRAGKELANEHVSCKKESSIYVR